MSPHIHTSRTLEKTQQGGYYKADSNLKNQIEGQMYERDRNVLLGCDRMSGMWGISRSVRQQTELEKTAGVKLEFRKKKKEKIFCSTSF